MFSKLTFLVVSLGIVGCCLLALRQQRLQAASEMAQAQLRVRTADERLFELRSQVAARITPKEVEKLAIDAGGLRPATNEIPGELTNNELTGLDNQGNFSPPPEEADKNAKSKPAAKPDGKPTKPTQPKKPSTGPSRYATRPQ